MGLGRTGLTGRSGPKNTVNYNQGDLENIVVDFYNTLFTSDGVSDLNLVLQNIPTIVNEETNTKLNRAFIKAEFWESPPTHETS